MAEQRNRPRITVTVDPDMLDEVDAYIRDHQGADRSQIVDDALRCWYAALLSESLVRQHQADRSSARADEQRAWRRIRAAQLARLEKKYGGAAEE